MCMSGCRCENWDGFEIWDGLRSGCGCEVWKGLTSAVADIGCGD